MTEQLKEIGLRLAGLREDCELSPAQMAERLGMDETTYLTYERGEADFSFSFLYNAAGILGVDVLDLMSGDSPRLSVCTVVRAGEGYEVQRNRAYNYRHLAFTFRDKHAEPFLVTVEPAEQAPALHAHEGQEFNYVVEGRMQFLIGAQSYTLSEGDSVYFNASNAHAIRALDGKRARFLAVVIQ